MSDTPDTAREWADKARDARGQAGAAVQAYGDRIKEAAADARDVASSQFSDSKANAEKLRDTASSLATDLKAQANAHLDDAKTVVSSMADEARNRISDIINQQKSLGADKLSGLSKAAQNAANDLDGQNPHVARLVRDAAGSVEKIAGDLRGSDLGDVVASVSSFARKQPIAFFAGSLLAGFVLARFIKSEPSADATTPANEI